MKRGQFEFCHCLNAFPGTDIKAKAEVFEKYLPMVRNLIPGASSAPFGAGIWFDADTVSYLVKSRKGSDFASYAKDLGFYAFTANAFPYGVFHGKRVKTSVYKPDWAEDDRREYTKAVADILSYFMLPESRGSISTLPGAYMTMQADEKISAKNILSVAEHFARIYDKTGKKIILGIEPEPDCQWGDIKAFIDFYQRRIAEHSLSEFVGICYDTCHQELSELSPGEGLDLIVQNNIPVAKIQLSSAIRACSADAKDALMTHFKDEVYLHQTREFSKEHILIDSFADLPTENRSNSSSDWVTHFHIPVFAKELPYGLQAASQELDKVLEKLINAPEICNQLEIETYSYHVLPDFLKSDGITQSMAKEMNSILERLSLL